MSDCVLEDLNFLGLQDVADDDGNDAAVALPAPTTPIVNIVHQSDYTQNVTLPSQRRRADIVAVYAKTAEPIDWG